MDQNASIIGDVRFHFLNDFFIYTVGRTRYSLLVAYLHYGGQRFRGLQPLNR